MNKIKKRALPLFAAVLAVVLTGCTRSEMTLTVGDGTVSGSIVMAVAEGMLTVDDGETAQTAVDEWLTGIDDPTRDVPGTIDVITYQEDGFIGRQVNLSGATFEALEERFAAYELAISHDGEVYSFEMVVDLTANPQVNADIRRDMEIIVSVTMPGDVVDTNGAIDGSTVTWTFNGTTVQHLTATAQAPPSVDESSSPPVNTLTSDDSGSAALSWIIVGTVALGALIALIAVLHQRRSRSTARQDLQKTQEMRIVRIEDPPPR